MSKISKMLQCSDCEAKLNEICDTLEYNDCEREIVAEVLLYLEMQKLKEKSVKKQALQDALKESPLKPNTTPMWPEVTPNYDYHTIKC